MFSIKRFFFILLALNGLALLFSYNMTFSNTSKHLRENTQGLFLQTMQKTMKTHPIHFEPLVDPEAEVQKFTRKANPFYQLGAYPQPKITVPYEEGIEENKYNEIKYGFFNDDDYCEQVDYYNLAHPENIFDEKQFFTDYARNSVPRQDVIPKIGNDLMTKFSKYGAQLTKKRIHHFDVKITSFLLNSDAFHKYHKIGKHFLCATQMFNHIPGHRAMIRKDDLVQSVDLYAQKFKDTPQCFNKKMFFPYNYRLYLKEECEEFFDKINSAKYKKSLKTDPIQFMIKVGHGSHAGDGVFILDKNQTKWLNKEYSKGKKCGKIIDSSLIAQQYISNPLLLDLDNKFDFRVFMLIASTNPLIVYYHDGVIRASLSKYDRFSEERGKHLTNTHLAESIFKKARKQKVYGMTEKQLREYHHWSMQEFADYLLEAGKITDPNWLDNYLRPQFRKAMVHIVKMSSQFFWKQSNVYGLFGVDFMLDDNFNLWFIEANPNPQLMAPTKIFDKVAKKVVKSMLEIEYGLYRSRMERVFKLLQKINEEEGGKGPIDYSKYKSEYKEAVKNRFESHYQVGSNNTFSLVMDESLPGAEAYLGHIAPECAGF